MSVARIGAACVLVLAILLAVARLAPGAAVPACGALVVFAVVFALARPIRHVHDRLYLLDIAVRDADAGIIALEHHHEPLRIMGRKLDVAWNRGTVAPDLANFLVQSVLLRRPERLLECGAGVSTRVLAECLRLVGRGRLVTLEHDRYWVDQVRSALEAARLGDLVDIRLAPLGPVSVEGRELTWYTGVEFRDIGPLDLVLVDGPPGTRPSDPGREAALYALFPLMKRGSLLFMDDGNRPGEKMAVERWKARYGDAVRTELLDLKKGLWVVEKLVD
jgi:predicted O-methyltransferase YrrM